MIGWYNLNPDLWPQENEIEHAVYDVSYFIACNISTGPFFQVKGQ